MGSSVMTKCAAVLAWLVLLVMAILTTAELVLGVVLADVCWGGPLNNIKGLLDSQLTGTARNLATYYLSCAGGTRASPVYLNFEKAKSYIGALKTSTHTMAHAGMCPSDALAPVYITGGIVDAALVVFETIGEATECSSSVNPLLVELLQGTMCTDMIEGVYGLWWIHTGSSFFLFVCLVMSEFVRPHFRSVTTD